MERQFLVGRNETKAIFVLKKDLVTSQHLVTSGTWLFISSFLSMSFQIDC
jgi:hypothetical protein